MHKANTQCLIILTWFRSLLVFVVTSCTGPPPSAWNLKAASSALEVGWHCIFQFNVFLQVTEHSGTRSYKSTWILVTQRKSLNRALPIPRCWDNWLFLFRLLYTSYRPYKISLTWIGNWKTPMSAEHIPEIQENYLRFARKTGPPDKNNTGTWKLGLSNTAFLRGLAMGTQSLFKL